MKRTNVAPGSRRGLPPAPDPVCELLTSIRDTELAILDELREHRAILETLKPGADAPPLAPPDPVVEPVL